MQREMEYRTSRGLEVAVSAHLLRDKLTVEKREEGGMVLLLSCLPCLLVA